MRRLLVTLGILLLALGAASPSAGPAQSNPDGNTTGALESPRADDGPQAIGSGRAYGYASATSVVQGGQIDFHISANVTAYDLRVYRLSSITGEELRLTVNNLPGQSYACGPAGVPAGQEGVALGCNWPVAYTLNVPANWPAGVYAANLLTQGEYPLDYGSYILFVVTEDQPAAQTDTVFVYPTATLQAYNAYGGWSFYTTPPARRITFDRPYKLCDPINYGCSDDWSMPMARWLALEGYAVDYIASEDLHNDPNVLHQYRLAIIAGHDEYWSQEMRDHLDAFSDAGGNVAIFSGNTVFRQVRYTDNGRTLVCYMGDYEQDPLYGVDNQRVATEFDRLPVPNWPENPTTGTRWHAGGYIYAPPGGVFTVYRTDHWVFANTGLTDGALLRYETQKEIEVDGALFTWQNGLPVVTGADQTPLDFLILGVQASSSGHATMGVFTRPGGGTVFNAATIGWPRGLWPDKNPDGYAAVRQITRNVLERLRSGPLPPRPIADVQVSTSAATVFATVPVTFTTTLSPTYATQPVTYTWSFGDGSPSPVTRTAALSHTFAAAGAYTLSVTADNVHGAAADQLTVTVAPPPILIQSVQLDYGPTAPLAGASVAFTATLTPANATAPITYTWRFGDGSPAVVTGASALTHTFAGAGAFTVSVKADNAHSQRQAQQTLTVTLPPVPLQAVHVNYTPETPLVGEVVTFTTAVTPLTATTPITTTWDFGDGSPIAMSQAGLITHTYAAAGDYPVLVNADNGLGQVTAPSRLVAVVEPLVPGTGPMQLFLPFLARRPGD